MKIQIPIDNLIKIIRAGGRIKTGVDVYNSNGILLLDKDVFVEKVKIMEIVKENSIKSVPVDISIKGVGIWDVNGNYINISDGRLSGSGKTEEKILKNFSGYNDIEKRLSEIEEIKIQAKKKYSIAKESVKKVLADIKKTGGEFDYDEVEASVSDLVDFLVTSDNPFSYLTQEIFSYDDYLYNHSVNVCAIATAVINRFNKNFSKLIDDYLKGNSVNVYNPFAKQCENFDKAYTCYYPDELTDISIGFFLHDIGKVIVSDKILNKEGKLTDKEFNEVKKHSYEYGIGLLEKNRLKNSVVKNIIQYHHAALYDGEPRCYPSNISHNRIPLYTKICKLADIYDAMTSKRCYKEAFNPINVVTQIFRTYAKKDKILQHILYSFVKSIGIYPPGSIVFLRNGQMAYVLESEGPLILPLTDEKGVTLKSKPDPLDMDSDDIDISKRIDNRRSIQMPKDVYDILPSYIKKSLKTK